MKNLFKFIVALGVFAMTIGSGFAMDNNPPSEPVKGTVETEVVEEAPMQIKHLGFYYYEDSNGNAVLISSLPPGSLNCTITNTGSQCMYVIDDIPQQLYGGRQFDLIELKWKVIIPLYEIVL